MSQKHILWIVGAVVLLILAAGAIARMNNNTETTDTSTASPVATSTATPTTISSSAPTPIPAATYKTLRAADAKAGDAYVFSAEIPMTWVAESAQAGEAIAIYDPAAAGATNLEKTQIYIRHFSASTFLTLSTVTIHSRTDTIVNSRPAVRYDIEKKPTVANFANQPTWRSARHIVTDVRVSNASPSEFYVIAKNPALSDATYAHFLETFNVVAPIVLLEPTAEFKARITKKPYGTYITPANSPVQPEKFTGYHTGVDVEYTDVTAEVPVLAIADGTVVASRTASGYGGVVAIQHTINGQSLIGVYGHVDPKSMVANGTRVTAGQQVAVLGGDKSSETDGERKHLHFSVVTGTALTIKGYVQTQAELAQWIDPLSLYS